MFSTIKLNFNNKYFLAASDLLIRRETLPTIFGILSKIVIDCFLVLFPTEKEFKLIHPVSNSLIFKEVLFLELEKFLF